MDPMVSVCWLPAGNPYRKVRPEVPEVEKQIEGDARLACQFAVFRAYAG